MKRGCEITHLHLDAGRWAGTDVTAAAIDNHRKLSLWCAGNPLSMVIADSEPFFDADEPAANPPAVPLRDLQAVHAESGRPS